MAVRVHRRFERPTVTLATCEDTDLAAARVSPILPPLG